MANPKIPSFPGRVPWFLYDLYNRQLITSPIVPGDIADQKGVVLAEVRVPGLGFSPVFPSGMNNRHVSFQMRLVKRNNTIGNLAMLKQLEALRVPAAAPGMETAGQFQSNPKVIYWWGTGSAPLVWYVARCDFTHHEGWINAMGFPQYTTADMELVLDERDPLNAMEEAFRRTMMLNGSIEGLAGLLPEPLGGRPPY